MASTPATIPSQLFPHTDANSSKISIDAQLGMTRVAVSRVNGDVEVWSPFSLPHTPSEEKDGNNKRGVVKVGKGVGWTCVGRVPGGKDVSIEALAFSFCRAAKNGPSYDSDSDSDSSELESTKKDTRQSMNDTVIKVRLFCASSVGGLVEIDLDSMLVKHKTDSLGGGAIWSLAVSPSHKYLAAGCEDGGIRLYDISQPDELTYVRTLEQRQKGRIMCLTWLSEEAILCGGGGTKTEGGTLRTWDVKSGRIQQRMSVGGPTQNHGADEEVFVWSACRLGSDMFVSGDSLGQVKIWDARTCTLVQTLSHTNDILSVCASIDRTTIFAASMDGKLMQFKQAEGRWVQTVVRKFHERDLRSLVWVQVAQEIPSTNPMKRKRDTQQENPDVVVKYSALVSGGVDSLVTVLENPVKCFSGTVQPTRILPYMSQHTTSFSPAKRRILAQYDHQVGLWQLGQKSDLSNGQPEGSNLYEPAKFIKKTSENARYLCQIVTWNHLNPYSVSISPCGNWVCVCEQNGVNIYLLEDLNSGVRLCDMSGKIHGAMGPARLASFNSEGTKAAFAGVNGSLFMLDLETFEMDSWFFSRYMVVDMKWVGDKVVVVDHSNQFYVFQSEQGLLSTSLPRMDDATISFFTGLEYANRHVIVGTASTSQGGTRLYAMDLESGSIEQTLHLALQNIEWISKRRERLIGCSVQNDSKGPVLYFYAAKWVGRVSISDLVHQCKKLKKSQDKKALLRIQECFRWTHRFSNVRAFGFPKDAGNEALVVEALLSQDVNQ